MPSASLPFRALLLRCARLLSDEINTILLSSQLNYSLWQVLYVIQTHQQCTLMNISHYLNVSKPSISKRIQNLVELGLISQLETADKRQKLFTLSEQGVETFALGSTQIEAFEKQLLEQIASDDIESSKNILMQLIQQLQPASQDRL
ncbi:MULTISPECIES: MarR family winged helix-turn-helix transcriptional regulator [Acinetobacter]|uniref:MarR family winged helix-turn-helix transcriptional regulator n=1 Tax=Acinetobacter TaxID=469 RepID=UPI00132FE038|nr:MULTISPECIES: winged helix DNA-binding protein [Acinetobacter]MCO8090926.1 winged helix DNA-binding protein [Acinetobacter pseudolwoffii]MCP0910363.1 winged helix DNA-binding protein [Acinetobacter pseudolwoffii]MDM1343533.1 winged helix DNA-binding protein [Acinetobacter pseudolwoffii]HJE54042.1 winged helix DNA-binding protein [Acinetobacter pseudolwoffii]